MYGIRREYVRFEDLKDLIFTSVEGLYVGSEKVIFTTDSGDKYTMEHLQDCCEYVRITDVEGDVTDLLFSPILFAEESSNSAEDSESYESATWTFYKLATVKGWLDIRWLGTSNGYYSESVSIYKVKGENNA